jgi:transposase-like protein
MFKGGLMKYFFALLIMIILLTASPILAGEKEYDDCILKYVKGAKVNEATRLVKKACKENYKNYVFVSDKRKEYNKCLLEHLMGIESSEAVMEIKKACDNKHLQFIVVD